MRASSRRMMSMMVSFLFLIGAFFIYSSLIRPEYALVNEQRGVLVSKQRLLENQREIISKVREVLDRYKETAQLQKEASLALPNEQEIPSLVNQVYAIARASGLTLESLTLSAQPVKGSKVRSGRTEPAPAPAAGKEISIVKTGTIQMNLQVSGTYQTLKTFLSLLETNVRIMDVGSLSFSASEKGSTAYTLTVNTYYQTK